MIPVAGPEPDPSGAPVGEPIPVLDPELPSSGDLRTSGDGLDEDSKFKLKDEQIALNVLLQASDFRAGGQILTDWMDDPSKAEQVQAWQVLNTAGSLFQQGDSDVASALLDRFDAWSTVHGVRPQELGPFHTARWTLLKELRVLVGLVEQDEIKLLAQVVENENCLAAATMIDRARNGALRRIMQRRAPNLLAAVSPKLSPSLEISGLWRVALMILIFGCLQALRHCGETSTIDRRATTRAVAAPRVSAAPPPRSAQHFAREIDGAAEAGDCLRVLGYWPLYVGALKVSDHAEYRARRERILMMCSELSERLPGLQ
jgi:hypothetical protein